MKYIDMVRNLSKPVEDIHAQLTPFKCGLIHSAMGISGEVSELVDAIEAYDVDNIKEELGDLYFYVMQAFMYLDLVPSLEGDYSTDFNGDLVHFSGEFTDLVKKHCIYNKQIDLVVLSFDLTVIHCTILNICGFFGLSLEEMIEHNTNKLLNGRYRSGSYSDAQAIERADKNV